MFVLLSGCMKFPPVSSRILFQFPVWGRLVDNDKLKRDSGRMALVILHHMHSKPRICKVFYGKFFTVWIRVFRFETTALIVGRVIGSRRVIS